MQKFEIWGVISGSVRPNMFLGLECPTHFSNSGSLSWPDLIMLAAILKEEIWMGDVGSREIGGWNFSGIRESIVLGLSAIMDILPKSDR